MHAPVPVPANMQRLALQQFVVTISNVVSLQHFGEIITRQQHRGGTAPLCVGHELYIKYTLYLCSSAGV